MSTLRLKKISPARGRLSKAPGKHVVVFGCGNIGSQLAAFLARIATIQKITLVDFDIYEERNLATQNVTPADLGQPKAEVQARRLRQLNPRLEVVALNQRLESVPLGRLRGDVMLACLDSKIARLRANEAALRLCMPLIDAGIEASGLLVRVSVFVPGVDQPCAVCSWDERDYNNLPIVGSCDAGDNAATPTNAPAFLGGMAAAVQANECAKFVTGNGTSPLAGREWVIELGTYRQYLTSLRKNPKCRCNHSSWDITRLASTPSAMTIGAALELTGRADNPGLGFGGMVLARRLDCRGCGYYRPASRLMPRLSVRERTCPRCGRELLAAGFYSTPQLNADEVDRALAARPLASLGLRPGDVISVGSNGRKKYFELAGPVGSGQRSVRKN